MTIWTHIEVFATLVILIGSVALFSRYKLWPAVTSIRDVAELLNTKGGIILLLGAFSMAFFFAGMRWLYWSTMLIVNHQLDPASGIVMNGFNWISGAAFMGAFGAMLSAMKGEPVPPPVTTVESTTTTTETKKTPDAPGTTDAGK
jgi:hypothetical protein